MSTNDLFQSIDALGAETIQRIVDRLEFRAKDTDFVRLREQYLAKMDLGGSKRLLDLGCGTGVVARSLARHAAFKGELVGVDSSDALIKSAKQLASNEGVAERVAFRVGDSHALGEPDASYDAVVAHTLISHVKDPSTVIAEAARVLQRGKTIAIFDGDYASTTFGAGGHELNAKIVKGILDTAVANPYVMRQLAGILNEHGLEVVECIPAVRAEAGRAFFFAGFMESYVPMAVKAGNLAEDVAEPWLAYQRRASEVGTFFAACNYYTYLARKR